MNIKRGQHHIFVTFIGKSMQRDVYLQLLDWKQRNDRKPLILRGARQVGKTFIIKAFAQAEYKNYIYINFEKHKRAHKLFEGDLDPVKILNALHAYSGNTIIPGNTLIIFDEIQASPDALNSLKYFNEESPEQHIIAAGSLLGVKIANTGSFPVGMVNFIDLYPLSFFEFLTAIDKAHLRSAIANLGGINALPEIIHEELMELLRLYIFIGGMPEAVKTYIKHKNYQRVREAQNAILDAYVLDFAKHAPPTQIMKIMAIWELIPSQLAKENKKFFFTAIKKSARAREYEIALQWLADAGLVYKSYQVETPKIPLEGYADKSIFKVFLLDVGLLGAMSKLPADAIIEGNQMFSEFKGALTENYVAETLATQSKKLLYYWVSSGRAEVDFISQSDFDVHPLEVKSSKTQRKRSLLTYGEKYHSSILYRTSPMNFAHDGKVVNYPLYAISYFPALEWAKV